MIYILEENVNATVFQEIKAVMNRHEASWMEDFELKLADESRKYFFNFLIYVLTIDVIYIIMIIMIRIKI